jgi:hypothetical protein
MRDRSVRALAVACAAAVSAAPPALAQLCSQHTYLGNRPDEGSPGWHVEAQGLAHDADNWYITQNPPLIRVGGQVFGGPKLWRVPVTRDLASGVDCDHDGVSCSELRLTALLKLGYDHFGDLDFHETGGRRFLMVPVEHGDPGPGVAFFRGDDSLEFLGVAAFPGQQQAASGWVAIDPAGDLISSGGPAERLNRFAVDWAGIPEHTPADPVLGVLTFLDVPILLRDPDGQALSLDTPQGGEFSDDGQLFYFSNGFLGDVHPSWGVHVFRLRTGSPAECAPRPSCQIARRIERSHNGPGGFAYEFNSTCSLTGGYYCEEAEGLTAWDLDADPRAPNVRGQLHVMLLDNDDFFDTDDIYVKHYRLSTADSVPPDIACPADTKAECSARTGVPAKDPQLQPFFAGVSATDACDDTPTLGDDAPALFGLGATAVTFTATDDAQNSSSCQAAVTVVDTTSPAIACPAPVTVECTGGGGISASDPQLQPFFAGASATDVCDPAPALSHDAPAFLPLGKTAVTFTARDHRANTAACDSVVRVRDTQPPQVTLALSHQELWPPNHRLVPVTATVQVTDRCDPSASFQLLSVTSNEPDDGQGDGDTSGDIQGVEPGTPDTSFLLRAERSGAGSGRVYAVVYRARDGAGNVAPAVALVRVPHHR